MKRITIKRPLTQYTNTWTGVTTRTLSSAWKGKRGINLCVIAFNRFFEIPRGCIEAVLVFSKTAHPEAYQMELGYYDATSTVARVLMVDGYDAPILGGAARMFKCLWNQGYNYVRLEVAI